MGCLHSTPSAPPTSPARALPNSDSTPSIPILSTPSRRPNAPIRRPKPWRSTSRIWTSPLLAREREAFFDTRVTGRPELWAAMRLAVDMVRAEGDMKGAQAVLDAAGLNCPTGKLGEGTWDERGTLYKLPRWVVSDPLNVVDGEEDGDGVATGDEDEEVDVVGKDGGEAEEKGKGKMMLETEGWKIKARLSDRGSDVVVSVPKQQSVRLVAKRIADQAELEAGRKVRLAYMGKILKDGESLEAQGWHQGHVVNALVF